MDCQAPSSYAFIFVCQQGRLENEAVLLAASLKLFVRCDHELIAAVPGPSEAMGCPSERTCEILQDLGVRLVSIENSLVSSRRPPEYELIANKIFCLRAATRAEKLIFLDSDILCRRAFHGDTHFCVPFNALQAGIVGSAALRGRWHEIFEATGTAMPRLRVRSNGSHEGLPAFVYSPPYFSAGVIGVDTSEAPRLSRLWEECFRQLEAADALGDQRYFQDQASLACAIQKSGLDYEILQPASVNSYFSHYLHPNRIAAKQELRQLARQCAEQHAGIPRLLGDDREWAFLRDNA